jgi:hypothetical protein
MSQELPHGWSEYERSIKVSSKDLSQHFHDFNDWLNLFTKHGSQSTIAFNPVRKVRAPKEYPELGFYTGLEGYYVSLYSAKEVAVSEKEIGAQLARTIDHLSVPLRKEVCLALDGTSYSLAAVRWLETQLGVVLARLKVLGYKEPAENLRENQAFQTETYRQLEVLSLDQRHVTTLPTNGETLIEFPLPNQAESSSLKPKSTEEQIMTELGKYGLPLFRTVARLS